MSALIATVLNVDLHAAKNAELARFLLGKEEGELTFTNDVGETYTIIRKNQYLSLRHPFGDYSGDPEVVARFNSFNFAPLSVGV